MKKRLFAAGACAVGTALSLAVIVAPAAEAAPGTVVSGGTEVFSGPGTSFGVIGSLPAGTAVSFSCFATGNGVTGPYGTETAWDRLDSGGFVPDALIYTGSNNPTAPSCATLAGSGEVMTNGALPVMSAPSTGAETLSQLAAGTVVSFVCYTAGSAVTGPYGTETAWDRLGSGGFVPDADIFTGSNSPTVPQCSTLGAPVSSFTVRGSHPVVNDGSQDTHASTPNAKCSTPQRVADDALGEAAAVDIGVKKGAPHAAGLLLNFLAGRGAEVSFPAGSTVSADAKASSEFNDLNNMIQAQLLQLLRAGYSTVVLPSSVVSPPNFRTASSSELHWGFGGTQGLSITGSGSLISGRYVGTINYIIWDSYGFTPQDIFNGIGTKMRYLQTVCGAPQTQGGAHWFLDSISLSVPFNQSASAPTPAPTGYNTGREVTVVTQATGGDSGHTGPANSYPAGPTHAAGSPIYIVCYVNGQSISGPYGTGAAWDLSSDGYYYSDAWLWTDSNGPVVPECP